MPTRVLVVDDNQLARSIIKRTIEEEGMEICGEAKNGEEAVEVMKSTRPDLVVLDFVMPMKDGLQAAREILQADPRTRIVLNTLYLTEQLRAVAEQAGVRHVVSKSNLKGLINVLNALKNPVSSPSLAG